jgi:t-SNARE complex subunit (syntaxin)
MSDTERRVAEARDTRATEGCVTVLLALAVMLTVIAVCAALFAVWAGGAVIR